MSWFERLVGFEESNPEQVRSNLSLNDGFLTSHVNGRSFQAGIFDTPSVRSLYSQLPKPSTERSGALTLTAL